MIENQENREKIYKKEYENLKIEIKGNITINIEVKSDNQIFYAEEDIIEMKLLTDISFDSIRSAFDYLDNLIKIGKYQIENKTLIIIYKTNNEEKSIKIGLINEEEKNKMYEELLKLREENNLLKNTIKDKEKRLIDVESRNNELKKKYDAVNKILLYTKKFDEDSINIKKGIKLIYRNEQSNKIRLFGNEWIDEYFKSYKGQFRLKIDNKIIELIAVYDFKESGIHEVIFLALEDLSYVKEMFFDCVDLEKIEFLGDLKIDSCLDYSSMFYNCQSLLDIDSLKNVDINKEAYFSFMFFNCTSLKNVEAVKNWKLPKNSKVDNMFKNCSPIIETDFLES